MSSRILLGDCREVMMSMALASVDAIVTDPPYHLTQASRNGSARRNDPSTPFGRTRLGERGFMGKTWDGGGIAFEPATWAAALTVAKPGARLLAFGGTRTFHRLTCAIEDAGWIIEDCVSWLYGSGFPKHKSKLKPAWEPIILARKPSSSSPHLNIDACRIPGAVPDTVQGQSSRAGELYGADQRDQRRFVGHDGGRWPANVITDEPAAESIDLQSGMLRSGANPERRGSPKTRTVYGEFEGQEECTPARGADEGGASRFYYCAKASRAEREAGLGEGPTQPLSWSAGTQSPGTFQSAGTNREVRNHHPTVKPIALMRWLCRLITPPGGTVLDPFCGSGSTGCAAELEGFEFIGIDDTPGYVEISRARVDHWAARREA